MNKISHYTTLSGFLSIIENSEIWATNIRFLNDNKELLYAYEILDETIEIIEAENKKPLHKNEMKFLESLKNNEELIEMGQDFNFVTCFSTKIDQLSQWRAYGNIGIVFNQKKLETSLLKKDKGNSNFIKCTYNKKDIGKKFLSKIINFWNQCKTYDSDSIDDLIMEFGTEIFTNAIFYKHEGFKEENEVRFAYLTHKSEEVQFRVKTSHLVPYIPIPFDLECIESVMLGPSVDPQRLRTSIELFLDKIFSDRKRPTIIHSSIPYSP